MDVKTCNKCKVTKSLSLYSRRVSCKTGKQGICKECYKIMARGRDYREANLKKKYNLTVAEFDRMLEKQNGVCKVCEGPSMGKGRFHVDHNHKTGRIRGLLCHKCNIALGMVQDNKETLMKLIKYLREENS